MNGICLILQFASTWAMVGLIWLIQIVHYPLFGRVGSEEFPVYASEHQRLITYVVLPLMFVELITSFWIWFERPVGVTNSMVVAGIVLVLLIWASTFFIQVPQHDALLKSFDADMHRKLVVGNWIRTIAWSLRGLLVGYMAWVALRR